MSADDGLDEFQVSSSRDVGTLLKQLLTARSCST
jgi:hypothetical protein